MDATQQLAMQQSSVARPVVKTQSLLRQSTAHLDRLPDGLEFPDGLRDRICFDPVQKQLVFRGLMSAADYHFLSELSDDPEYLGAVRELHHHGAFETDHVTPMPTWLWVLGGACLAGAAIIWWFWLVGT